MSLALLWGGFHLLVVGVLALDLGVLHKRAETVSPKEALGWTMLWAALSLAWCGMIYFWRGPDAGLSFLTGYLIEESLSLDNIFVFVLILNAMRVPKIYQHRVLLMGVLGALVMRATLIGVGSVLVSRFHWLLYLFGGILIVTGVRMAVKTEEPAPPEKSRLIQALRRWLPMTPTYREDRFMVQENGRRLATPLLLVLVMIEMSDAIFAFDSIPAIFSVTTDPFIVYTSNIFAIMGLRSLYFLLASVIERFRFLKYGIAAVLVFVGGKMVGGLFGLHLANLHSLLVILATLTAGIGLSLLLPEPAHQPRQTASGS